MKVLNRPPAPSKTSLDPNSPVPIREQTVRVLREAILNFDLMPGQRLVEREFISQLGISRTTFREALRQLSSEGLVTVVAQKGARVASPSTEEAADLYEIRAALEVLVVQRFIERATEEEFANLRLCVEDYERIVAETTDATILFEENARYYRILADGARSKVLDEVLTGIRSRTYVFRSRALSIPGRPAQTAVERRLILDAILVRDTIAASELCAEHVHIAGRVAIDVWMKSPARLHS